MLKPKFLLVPIIALFVTSCQKDSSIADASLNGKPIKKDITPPTIQFNSPADHAVVWNTDLAISMSDDLGLSSLEILENERIWYRESFDPHGRAVKTHSTSIPFNMGLFDMRTLTAVATDLAGNKSSHQITLYKLVCRSCN